MLAQHLGGVLAQERLSIDRPRRFVPEAHDRREMLAAEAEQFFTRIVGKFFRKSLREIADGGVNDEAMKAAA